MPLVTFKREMRLQAVEQGKSPIAMGVDTPVGRREFQGVTEHRLALCLWTFTMLCIHGTPPREAFEAVQWDEPAP